MSSSQQGPRLEPRRVGVSDVAKRAGVAIGTVSNYLNYPERVSDALKAKIKTAIDELGYVPRLNRVRQQTAAAGGLIGYVMTDIEHSLFVDVFEGVQEVCEDNGMQVVGSNSSSDDNRQAEQIRMFIRLGCKGIVLSTVTASERDVAAARAAGVQIVLVDYANPLSAAPASSVLENNVSVGQIAAEELIRTGCTRLAFVAHSFDYQAVRDRYEGVCRAVERRGKHVSLELIDSQGLMLEDGYEVGGGLAKRFRCGGEVPDGIVAASDQLGVGVIRALTDDGGLRVPDDVGVIGCEGVRLSHAAPVPLTTVDAPGNDMGRKAMSELLDAISNPVGYVTSVTLLEPRLHRRDSTRA